MFHFLNIQNLLAIPLAVCILVFIFIDSILLLIVRSTGRLVEKWSYSKAVRRCKYQLQQVKTYDLYKQYSLKLDRMTNREIWKATEEPPICGADVNYNVCLLKSKIQELHQKRQDADISGLALCIKSCFDFNLYDTFNTAFYSMTYSGTKYTIEAFQNELISSIETLKHLCVEHPHLQTVISCELSGYLTHCSRAFGYTCLVFSGGAMLGLHHLGILEVLITEKCLPKIIAGTSAGSIIAALACTKSDSETLESLHDKSQMNILLCPFVPNNWWGRFLNFINYGYTIQENKWKAMVDSIFQDITFLEAFHTTGRILNVTVSQVKGNDGPIILHYRNAPHVLISSAVLASTSLPYLSCPVQLYEKNPITKKISLAESCADHFYTDGSLEGDVPSNVLRSTWNVKYVVVSQVNIHIFPFLELRTHGSPGCPVKRWASPTVWRGGFLLGLLEILVKEHLRFLTRVLSLSKILPTIKGINVAKLALQSYKGDINLYPSRIALPHAFVMNNVPSMLLDWYIQGGRTMVFPKLPIIKTRMKMENVLRSLESALRPRFINRDSLGVMT